MRVLLIEDDPKDASYILKGLAKLGHVGDHLTEGRDGLIAATTGGYDVIMVDRMLPGLEGLAIVKTLRGAGVKTPILFLTARKGVADRVAGLNAGGDDYLTKPFAFSEFLARLEALARRPPLDSREIRLTVADLEIDLIEHRVNRGGRQINLL